MIDYMKEPCKHCPFRVDVIPFLHPERAEQIAHSTQNPYSDFPCHKTTVSGDDEGSENITTGNSKTCAGFLTMMANNDDSGLPEGFKPAWDLCYIDPYEMAEAYEIQWNKSHKKKKV